VNTLALIASAGMFAFSGWMYAETGDWVALVFMVLSGAWGLFFAGRRNRQGGA